MNIKEYISSGIVESYVLGLADPAERAEFESMCAAHDEVRAARDAFEVSLERQAMVGSVMPPKELKTKLFAEIARMHPGANVTSSNVTSPDITSPNVIDNRATASAAVPDTHVRKIQTNYWSKYMAAASVVLLIGSTILNFYLFNQYQDYSQRYAALLASQTELANNNRVLQASVDNYRNTIAKLNDPQMSIIKMAANNVPNNGSPDPKSVATIYWNRQSAEVYLMINNLPAPTSGKQYQLWAIVGGKPVSAGVFNVDQPDAVKRMINIPAAEAFAVTLENEGGAASPQGAMYVLGAI